jgi:pyrophosphatase PpaX
MHSVELVLFDFDGTLADTIPLILASFRHATRTIYGKPLPDDALLSNVGQPLRAQMEVIDPERAQELFDVYREHNAANHDAMIRPFPGVSEALAALGAGGLRLAVVTSKARPFAERGLRVLGMQDVFDLVVAVEDTQRHKPDPQPLQFALERLEGEPSTAAYVGDSPFDIAAGKAAGLATVAVTWGAFGKEDLCEAGPDHVIGTPEELVELVLSGPARAAAAAGACGGHGGAG